MNFGFPSLKRKRREDTNFAYASGSDGSIPCRPNVYRPFRLRFPPHLIAQHPTTEREASRLMVLNRGEGGVTHHSFRDLPDFLNPGDLLVLNDTRVLPARLSSSSRDRRQVGRPVLESDSGWNLGDACPNRWQAENR